MKRWVHLPLALVLAGALACDRTDRTAANDMGATGTPGAAGTTGDGDLGMMDRSFVEDQLEDGHAEVKLGRLAQERASHPEVRAFAEMMVRDHTKAGDELKQIAGRHEIRSESAEGHRGEHDDLHERLSRLSGAEFDREYMNAMVNDHEEAVREVEGKTDTDNAALKQWAASTLPALRQHLERARSIQQKLGGTTGAAGTGMRTPDTEAPGTATPKGKKY